MDMMAAERADRMVLKQAEGNEDKEADEVDEVGGRREDGLDEAEEAHTDVNKTMVREVEPIFPAVERGGNAINGAGGSTFKALLASDLA